MSKYRFILEPYNSSPGNRFTCPQCDHEKEFTFYVDTLTGQRLPAKYGRCNRANNCGYHLSPYSDGYKSRDKIPLRNKIIESAIPGPLITHIEKEELLKSLKNYDENNFIKYITNLFGGTITQKLIKKYFIGTESLKRGATVFWQVDSNGIVRTGKIIKYDPQTGKRIKKALPNNHDIAWIHMVLKLKRFSLNQCFFGEHLLTGNTKPIAIVESEKTSIIASVYFPKYTWLASGGKEGISEKKCEILRGRKVVLFPDLNAFDSWNKIAIAFGFDISDILERNATDDQRTEGWDLADYLINCDSSGLAITDHGYPVMWDVE
jgi:hypothetical protein